MQIGDEVITREQMPAMQAWQANESHLRQSIQDVLNATLNTPLMPPAQEAPAQGTAEGGSSQWNQ